MNGKGDKWRKTNYSKYYSNYDEINWQENKKSSQKEIEDYVDNDMVKTGQLIFRMLKSIKDEN